MALGLSLIFIYMVLAARFESFIHPFTIMASLPVALPFGLLSLVATGFTMNIFSAIGVLMLFGVVKKTQSFRWITRTSSASGAWPATRPCSRRIAPDCGLSS